MAEEIKSLKDTPFCLRVRPLLCSLGDLAYEKTHGYDLEKQIELSKKLRDILDRMFDLNEIKKMPNGPGTSYTALLLASAYYLCGLRKESLVALRKIGPPISLYCDEDEEDGDWYWDCFDLKFFLFCILSKKRKRYVFWYSNNLLNLIDRLHKVSDPRAYLLLSIICAVLRDYPLGHKKSAC